ncbi:DUF6979 family protein [Acidicapsa ligni]|uniref:DUF6979 family protein n=1 Tax=Acidicapsa ligni TaxID=542300 RepID=UPI0021DFCFE5|nr:hypothetical protein [Acidicapsa ligni]
MANRYGEAALMAARQSASQNMNPMDQWQIAMESLYPTSIAARKKGSPRAAFLGLCEEGLVKGIPAGHYRASKDDKASAIRAAALLVEGSQSWSIGTLWKAVSENSEKPHNSQLDVVMALWKNDLIVRNP